MTWPSLRVRSINRSPLRPDGEFVLYWMVATRRRCDNFALEHAVSLARELDKPLLVFEALRVDYPHASDRLHRFVLDGMAQNERDFGRAPVTYYPYVEPEPGHGRGLIEALGARAAVVVSDDFPCFFLPHMHAAAAAKLPVRLDLVDSNGLVPLRAAPKAFSRAFDFRRWLQRELAAHLHEPPAPDPLLRSKLRPLPGVPRAIARRWPRASAEMLAADTRALSRLPIDHGVPPAPRRGGSKVALHRAEAFVASQLDDYAEARQHPDRHGCSELSPYLHFGHLSPHRILALVAAHEDWSPDDFGPQRRGQKERFWQMRPGAEAYLEELVVWRELSYNFCAFRRDYDRYSSLPEWSRATLKKHRPDRRAEVYTLERLERAETGDELWNAAQRELVATGGIHGYLRMLWGKKVIEWSRSPEEALKRLIHLNDRYALDGRDPNSYSGILWCFGRYDRAWGPERPIFGTVRYMSSESARRKLELSEYLERFSGR